MGQVATDPWVFEFSIFYRTIHMKFYCISKSGLLHSCLTQRKQHFGKKHASRCSAVFHTAEHKILSSRGGC